VTPPELGISSGALFSLEPFPSSGTLLQRRGKNALRVSIPGGSIPQPLTPGPQRVEQSPSLGVEACLPSERSVLLAMVGGEQEIAQGESWSHVAGNLTSHGESAVQPVSDPGFVFVQIHDESFCVCKMAHVCGVACLTDASQQPRLQTGVGHSFAAFGL
jgi:hypothetical protein